MMRLNHQGVPLSRVVIARSVQSAFPVASFFVLPCVNASLPQFDVFELRIGIPNDSRFLFSCSNQQRRLIEPLFHSDFETAISDFRLALDLPNDLPSAVSCSSI